MPISECNNAPDTLLVDLIELPDLDQSNAAVQKRGAGESNPAELQSFKWTQPFERPALDIWFQNTMNDLDSQLGILTRGDPDNRHKTLLYCQLYLSAVRLLEVAAKKNAENAPRPKEENNKLDGMWYERYYSHQKAHHWAVDGDVTFKSQSRYRPGSDVVLELTTSVKYDFGNAIRLLYDTLCENSGAVGQGASGGFSDEGTKIQATNVLWDLRWDNVEDTSARTTADSWYQRVSGKDDESLFGGHSYY